MRAPAALALLFATTLVASRVEGGVLLRVEPPYQQVDPLTVVTLAIAIGEPGDPINGYDAVVGYDPTRLEYLPPSPPSSAEGPLFTGACPQRFLVVTPTASTVTVSHVLLCSATNVTGPGVLYQVRFRALTEGRTRVDLLAGSAAYRAGEYVEPLQVEGAVIDVGEVTQTPRADRRIALWAAPNPFNPATELHCEIPRPSWTALGIFDPAGRRVCEIHRGPLDAGIRRFVWRGVDDSGRPVASGVYLVRLDVEGAGRATTRLVLIR